jgi:outer membrane murein-binding lipoprotein Lpp
MDTGGLYRSQHRNRLGLVAVLLSGLALAGCSSQKVTDYDILWSDGKCIFHASVLTLEQAEELRKEWEFKDCDVDANVSDRKGKKP